MIVAIRITKTILLIILGQGIKFVGTVLMNITGNWTDDRSNVGLGADA